MKRKPLFVGPPHPSTIARTMFAMPTLGGEAQLAELVGAYGGAERVCKDFRIGPDLLVRYLTGQMEPPLTLLLALYWQGPYGFSHGLRDSHWTNHYNFHRAESAEREAATYRLALERLRRLVPLAAWEALALPGDLGTPRLTM